MRRRILRQSGPAPPDPRARTVRYCGEHYIRPGRRREGLRRVAAGRVKVLVVSVVDVPVIIQREFQQSMSYENLEEPQIQFIVRVSDMPVVAQRQVLTVQTFTLQMKFLEVVDNPVVAQRQVRSFSALTRWSMSLLCRLLAWGSSSSWTRSLNARWCATTGVCRDSAENC